MSPDFHQMNWVFATTSDFLIPKYFQPNIVDLRYFKLWIMLDQIIQVWNIKGLNLPVAVVKGIRKFGFVAKTHFLL